jgi:hypothetical protein
MANIVYLPPTKSLGGSLGEGMSMGIMKSLEQRERQERIAKVKEAFIGIKGAADKGGRQAALEAANIALGLAEDPADVRSILSYVDQVAPPDNMRQVPIVTEGNKPSVAFIPESKLGQLHGPEAASLLPPGTRMGIPEEEQEFIAPAPGEGEAPRFLGKAPISKPPPGGVPVREFELGRQVAADVRAAKNAERAEEREARLERQAELAEAARTAAMERATSVESRQAANQMADNYTADIRRGENTLLTLTGGRRLEDGSFSFLGENEKKLFHKRVPALEQKLQEAYATSGGKPVNVTALVREVVEKYPGGESKEEIAPPAPKKQEKKGLLDKAGEVIQSAKEKLTGKKAAPAAGAGEGKLPVVKTQADYDKLPPGASFVDETGRPFKKPEKKKK